MTKLLLVIFFLAFSFPSTVFAASTTFSSSPSQVKIGQEFSVSFTATSLSPNADYYFKSRMGPDTSHLTKGQTKGTNEDFLSESDSWASGYFPKLTSDENGQIQGQISSRVSPSVGQEGTYIYILRVLKVGDDTGKAQNLDGSFNFTVAAAPATPTPTGIPIPTATPPKIPTPTKTPTPKKTPTPTKIPSSSSNSPNYQSQTTSTNTPNTPTAVQIGKVLGEIKNEATEETDVSSASTNSSTPLVKATLESKEATNTKKPTNTKMTFFLPILGGLFLIVTGALIFYKKRHGV